LANDVEFSKGGEGEGACGFSSGQALQDPDMSIQALVFFCECDVILLGSLGCEVKHEFRRD
jgi:hypothetical protein